MTQADNRVLVTGATGFLGGWLVNRLSADGVPVRALARRPDRDRYIKDLPHVEIVQGDITDGARMQEVIQRCSVVYHVAAALGGNIDHQRRVNVGGTRTVAEAAASVGVRRIVHVSTIAVYGYRNRADVTEDTPFDPGHDPYNITKAEAETALREVCAAHGLEYTIIRPGMIYGPRSNTWTRIMFRLARRKPTIFIGDGSGSAYPIHVDDVVDLMTVLASHDATPGEAFNCTPDPSPTWRDFLGAYSRLAGHDRWLGIPPWLVWPVARAAALFAPKHNRRKDLPDLLPFLQRYITYRMDKARTLLGWEPRFALGDGVASCVPYLREKGLLP